MTTTRKLPVLTVLLALACTPAAPNRYPLQAPLWSDPDRNHVPATPEKRFSGLVADGADQIAFRRLSETLAFRQPGEARNVNALDEVPSSSWFENRIGLRPMTPEEVRQGPCTGPFLDPARGPWRITGAKPDGANPGFFVTAPDGRRYLLKMDSQFQPERATTADVVGSKLFFAAGYFTPCNEVVKFARSVLVIDPKATRKDEVGHDVPITQRDVDQVLLAANVMADGTLRASASQFVPGTPMGPFRYEGTRPDDPNDVIPHEDRRELRAARLFSAWVNHFDSREQNSLDVWVKEGDRQYLRHYLVDWGDSMGSIWDKDEISRRLGHTGYLDFDHVAVDLVTLGLYPRPWFQQQRSEQWKTFGYFTSRDFVPAAWRAGYPNPAYERMTARDGAWAARILARLSDEHLRAAVSAARMSDPAAAQFLVRTLAERRDQILAQYLPAKSPLTRFMLVRRNPGEAGQSLCFEDDAVRTHLADPARRVYRIRALAGAAPDQVTGRLQFSPDAEHPHRSCIRLPLGGRRAAPLAARDDDPRRYQVVEIASDGGGDSVIIRAHLYDLGQERGYHLVGLERT